MKVLTSLLMIACWLALPLYAGSIKNTKHNLSIGNIRGDIKSSETSMICIFCHTSHGGAGAQTPLWNREDGQAIYTLYDSTTLYSVPGQPDGTSKMCLSCHDGTVALGRVLHRKKEFAMLKTSMGRMPRGRRTNLGSDLSDDHPISFNPDAAVATSPELMHPPAKDTVRYDSSGILQCTTCHDPHNDTLGHFLVKSNRSAELCKTCHNISGFNGISSHDISSNTWNGQGRDPWPHTNFSTTAENSCMNCHRSHSADGKERLLSDSLEEEVCFSCHDGSTAKDIRSDFYKLSKHNVFAYQGVHDPTEDLKTSPKHVECADCHNPHASNRMKATAPGVSGSLRNVSGMTITGNKIKQAVYEYEICLKCHGEDMYHISSSSERMFSSTANIRTAFQPTNASFHPVAARGKNSTGNYSLLPEYMPGASRIYCSDCHSSDSGLKGPHGSAYEFLLEKQYVTSDYSHWSRENYALCYKCHDAAALFNENASSFPLHAQHVRDQNAPCSVCHDPHGSPQYIGLLNFDQNVVFTNTGGMLKFEVFGSKGYCYMQCHGYDHAPAEYDRR